MSLPPQNKALEQEQISFNLPAGERLIAAIRRSSRAKKVTMRMSPQGGLTLTVPMSMEQTALAKIAPEFLPWLERAWARRQNLPCCGQELPTSLCLPMLNRNLTLKTGGSIGEGRRNAGACLFSLVFSAGPKRILVNMEDEILRFYGHVEDQKTNISALRAFTRGLAGRVLPPYVINLANAAGYGQVLAAVRDQKSRWGSCSRRQDAECVARISLNWRALLLPVELLEHLCWHELAHTRQMNHSAFFYAELARNSPDWRQKEKDLSKSWRNMAAWAFPD